MFLFRSTKVGDKPKPAEAAADTKANANTRTKTTVLQIENTGRSPAGTTDESSSPPAITSEPKATPGSTDANPNPKSRARRARCCICSKQGPTTANHCACFHTSPQHVARVAAKVSIMMNIIPVLYIILSLATVEDVIPGKIYGSLAFIVCTLILLGLSALLVVGISKKKPRLGIPWIVCQSLMLVFIIALAVINYRNYEKSVPEHHHLGNSSMSNSTATTQAPNITSPTTTPTPLPNITANSSTAFSSTPMPADAEETANPLAIIYLIVVFYLSYHTIVVICLIWMVVNFFVGLAYARSGAKVKPAEDETGAPSQPQPQQESAPDSSTPEPTTGTHPPEPMPKTHTPNSEVDPETLLHETQKSRFHDYEAELEDV